MRDKQVDVGGPQTVAIQNPMTDLARLSYRELEHRRAILMHVVESLVDRVMRRGKPASTGGHPERGPAATVHLMGEIENAQIRIRRGRDDDRAGPVPEDHTGGTVLIINDPRHDVGADRQRMVVRPRRHHLHGGRHRVGET